MSDLRVNNLRGRTSGSAPTLPDGAVISGVTTVTTLNATTITGNGSGLTGINVGGDWRDNSLF